MNRYDCIVVGAGPAGIFACYELSLRSPGIRVLLLEKGNDLFHRSCPIIQGKVQFCPLPGGNKTYPGCQPACSITNGFGGAGAWSDGKFNIPTEFGGWMTDYLSTAQVLELLEYVDKINLEHGATPEITNPNTEAVRKIEARAYAAGLKLLRAKVRHLGTEYNIKILKSVYEYLRDKVEMRFRTAVADIITVREDGALRVKGVITQDGEEYLSDFVLSPQVEMVPAGYDGHPRSAKTPYAITSGWESGRDLRHSHAEINENLYEGKFIYNTSSTQVDLCSNPSGHVVWKPQRRIAANGHAKADPSRGSQYQLRPPGFPQVYRTLSSPMSMPGNLPRANDLSSGGLIIQKFGDIMRAGAPPKSGFRGFIEPTSGSCPGDLGLVLPYTTMKSLIEMTHALDKVTPGIASDHTILYGVEAKFYSARPKLTVELETEVKGLYCGGDGAGITRGLAQAGASGVWVARCILDKM